MPSSTAASAPLPSSTVSTAGTRHILGFVFFTFIVYLSIGLPLAVLPPYVHLRMGYSAALAGLVISIQYIATLFSRPWAGHISDRVGAKVSVLWGMGACSTSGALLMVAAALHAIPWLSFAFLILSRLVLGVGESLGSTGSTLWGISSAGQASTAKIISFNGISTYGAMALGAPLGVALDSLWSIRMGPCLNRPAHLADWRIQSRSGLPQKLPCLSLRANIFPSAMCSAAWPRTVWAWRWAAWVTACWPHLSRSFT